MIKMVEVKPNKATKVTEDTILIKFSVNPYSAFGKKRDDKKVTKAPKSTPKSVTITDFTDCLTTIPILIIEK